MSEMIDISESAVKLLKRLYLYVSFINSDPSLLVRRKIPQKRKILFVKPQLMNSTVEMFYQRGFIEMVTPKDFVGKVSCHNLY